MTNTDILYVLYDTGHMTALSNKKTDYSYNTGQMSAPCGGLEELKFCIICYK